MNTDKAISFVRWVLRIVVPVVSGLAVVAALGIYKSYGDDLICQVLHPPSPKKGKHSNLDLDFEMCQFAGWDSIECGLKLLGEYEGWNEISSPQDKCVVAAFEQRKPFRFAWSNFSVESGILYGIASNQRNDVYEFVYLLTGSSFYGFKHLSAACETVTIFETVTGKILGCHRQIKIIFEERP